MRNADLRNQDRVALLVRAQQSIAEGNFEEGAQQFAEYYETLGEEIIQEARALTQQNDSNILNSRGVRQLTTEESEYYGELIQALQSPNFKQEVNNIEKALPETVFNDVFTELRGNYPLLDKIDFQFIPGLVKFLMNTGERNKAVWGELTAAITEEVKAGLKEVQAGQYMLSAFIYVNKSMLELGAVWLDRFVREVLYDALQYGLEDGYVNGNGINGPIGMIRDISAPVDPVTGYAEKTAIKLTSFKRSELGVLMKTLAKGVNGNTRSVGKPLFLYNPLDWYTKIHPAAYVYGPNGYVSALAFDLDFVECISVPEGKAVIGIGSRYMGTIATSKEGKIEFSDHFRFLNHDRTYTILLYGNGLPKDNNAFLLLDIADIEPFFLTVDINGVVKTEEVTPAG